MSNSDLDDLLALLKPSEPPPREFSEHDSYALRRIRRIVREDALERHGDRPGEPSWDVIADCVLANACQHRQAREILKTPASLTLDQHATAISRQLGDDDLLRKDSEAFIRRVLMELRNPGRILVTIHGSQFRASAENCPEQSETAPSMDEAIIKLRASYPRLQDVVILFGTQA